MKKWNLKHSFGTVHSTHEDIIHALLHIRGITREQDIEAFFHPKDPTDLTCKDVNIQEEELIQVIARLKSAIEGKESIVVYADYDADGITAGAILWEALYIMGAHVMPYIPHRQDEGYGFSKKGLDSIHNEFHPTLVVSVDHGITAYEFVEYARESGMEIIVTDHHLKPKKLPSCLILHTTELSGAGIAYFLAKELLSSSHELRTMNYELLPFAAIGTIADMVPLVGANRSIAKYGLDRLNTTKRVGLLAIMKEAGLVQGSLTTYSVSHMIAPRLNAMGRLTHALDALRLLCTKNATRAEELAKTLGLTNKERQQMTLESVGHAKGEVVKLHGKDIQKKILVIAHESYNPGIIGLVAGKLVEEHFRPAIVIAKGELISKASARSIPGFNIVDAIRKLQELLIDVGGHPLAAGFTIETKHIESFQKKLEEFAEVAITQEMMVRSMTVDLDIPLTSVTEALWENLKNFQPYGLGNPEPVFMTRGVNVAEARLIGAEKKHVKLMLTQSTLNDEPPTLNIQAVAFNQADMYPLLTPDKQVDIAYTIDMNEWNGKRNIQLVIRDVI